MIEAPKILFLSRQRPAFPSEVLLNNKYTGSHEGISYAIETPPNGICKPIPDIARQVSLHASANFWAL